MIKSVNDILYIEHSSLCRFGLPLNTAKSWQQRGNVVFRTLEGKKYVQYDTIPAPTLATLPTVERLHELQRQSENAGQIGQIKKAILNALENGYKQHVSIYREKYRLKYEKAVKFAQDRAVWDAVFEFHKIAGLSNVYAAYDLVFPGRYSNKFSFSNQVKKNGQRDCALLGVDTRIFNQTGMGRMVSPENKFWVAGIASIGKKYGCVAIHKKLLALCAESGIKCPSLSWVKKYYRGLLRGNYTVFSNREGATDTRGKKSGYLSTIPALYPNDQWQMDGWELPFWGSGKFERSTLVVVRDANSKKIVGYSLGKTENTLVITEALRDAVSSTGYLPGEIVLDNHSFNQTKEAEYLKENTAKLGVIWTVTSNPQHKSIAERHFKHLDAICKDYEGYLGEGVKSRNRNGRPNGETMDYSAKTQLSENKVKAIAVEIVDTFNNQPLKDGKTPSEIYESGEKINCLKADVFTRVQMLTPTTEATVTRGQINIVRSNVKYEYQLPAALFNDYNGVTVLVNYEDLNDCVYLYDKKTGVAIGCIPIKQKAHGAKVNQTEKDIEIMNSHKGRQNGIKAAGKRAVDKLRAAALYENPKAIDLLQKHTIPKDVVKVMEQNSNLKARLLDIGGNPATIEQPMPKSEIKPHVLRGDEKKEKSPFSVVNKGPLKKIKL